MSKLSPQVDSNYFSPKFGLRSTTLRKIPDKVASLSVTAKFNTTRIKTAWQPHREILPKYRGMVSEKFLGMIKTNSIKANLN